MSASSLFDHPVLHLRETQAGPAIYVSEAKPPFPSTSKGVSPATQITLERSPEPNYTLDTGALRNSIENSGKFYLTRTEQQFDNPVNKFVDRIFSPEIVHLGKVPVACTVVTAIKRKNPLCLLNPYFFQAFW